MNYSRDKSSLPIIGKIALLSVLAGIIIVIIQIQNNPSSKLPETSQVQTEHYQRGLSYYEQKLYEQAIAEFDKAIELAPNYAFAYLGRGKVFYVQEKYEASCADLDKALKIFTWKSAYFERGKCRYKLKLYQAAIQDFAAVLAEDSTFADAYHHRGESVNRFV